MRRSAMTAAVLVAAGMAVAVMAGVGPEKPAKARPGLGVKSSPPSRNTHNGEPMVRVRAGAPAANTPKTHELSPAAREAAVVVESYLDMLRDGEPFDAVRKQLDTDVLLHSVFGEDLADLPAGEREYLSDLTRNIVQAAVTVIPMHEALADAKLSEPEAAQQSDSQVTIKITRLDAEPGQPADFLFTLTKGSSGWKIVDLPPLGETWRTEYASVRAHGVTPTDYTESLMAGMISRKHEARESARRDALGHEAEQAMMQIQADTEAALKEIKEAGAKAK